MKLTKTERAAVLLTVVFVALTAGYQLGARREGAEMLVSPERVLTAAAEPAPASAPARAAPEAEAATAGRVNINTAGAEELKTLSGVGDALAERILAFREEHGAFEQPEDIMRVSGIGERIFERNRERIATEGEEAR